MGDEPILPIIQPITINTMLNNNGPNIGDKLNFITCERSLNHPSFNGRQLLKDVTAQRRIERALLLLKLKFTRYFLPMLHPCDMRDRRHEIDSFSRKSIDLNYFVISLLPVSLE